jgi:hypothetical protein
VYDFAPEVSFARLSKLLVVLMGNCLSIRGAGGSI